MATLDLLEARSLEIRHRLWEIDGAHRDRELPPAAAEEFDRLVREADEIEVAIGEAMDAERGEMDEMPTLGEGMTTLSWQSADGAVTEYDVTEAELVELEATGRLARYDETRVRRYPSNPVEVERLRHDFPDIDWSGWAPTPAVHSNREEH